MFSDYILYPQLKSYIIYDNGASLENRGISFTRDRFKVHLHKYYRKHHTNKGYILLIDFSKYYDNIIHKFLKQLIRKYIKSKFSLWLFDLIIDNFKIDVSFLNDEQFKDCLKKKFDGLKYSQMDENNFTGEKFMEKSLGIGDQVSQISSVFSPTDMDNYCKIVLHIKFYDRYMDDTAIIDEDKEKLKFYFHEIKKITDAKGIFINNRKTHICKIGEWFAFLQFRYKLTPKGKVLIRINPNTIVRERRKLNAFKRKFDNHEMTFKDINTQYSSWMGNFYKYMSKNQRTKINNLFNELFVNDFVAYGGNKYSKNIIANKKKKG